MDIWPSSKISCVKLRRRPAFQPLRLEDLEGLVEIGPSLAAAGAAPGHAPGLFLEVRLRHRIVGQTRRLREVAFGLLVRPDGVDGAAERAAQVRRIRDLAGFGE